MGIVWSCYKYLRLRQEASLPDVESDSEVRAASLKEEEKNKKALFHARMTNCCLSGDCVANVADSGAQILKQQLSRVKKQKKMPMNNS